MEDLVVSGTNWVVRIARIEPRREFLVAIRGLDHVREWKNHKSLWKAGVKSQVAAE